MDQHRLQCYSGLSYRLKSVKYTALIIILQLIGGSFKYLE